MIWVFYITLLAENWVAFISTPYVNTSVAWRAYVMITFVDI